MKVLVLGSARHLADVAEGCSPEAPPQAFTDACTEVGRALADKGFHLVIGSTRINTVDYWVLKGAAEVAGTHRVTVLRPEGRGETRNITDFNGRGSFHAVYRSLPRQRWSDSRLAQVAAADVVLAIGGGSGTTQTCQTAVDMEKPVLVVPSFKGAAGDLWTKLLPIYDQLGERGKTIGQLKQPWGSGSATVVVELLPTLVKSRVFSRSQLSSELASLLINVTLFACWVLLYVAHWGIYVQAQVFTLLAVSAFLGTSLRNSLRLVADPSLYVSWRLLVAEVNAGLGLALILSLLYLGGTLAFTGSVADLVTRGHEAYQRVALFMGVIGTVGGWLLETTARRVTDALSDPLLLGK